jgi:hypothetical protein
VGVRYLVIVSPEIKSRLEREAGIKARHDLGSWSVFELTGTAPERAAALAFRPALVVSDFSLKQRRRNGYDFIRWAEEQFADRWFDVLLARSPETRIDRLAELEDFGALILDAYDYDDEDSAFERLRGFAQHRALILLSGDSPLFRRIASRLSEFPLATVVERVPEPPGEMLRFDVPTMSYESTSIRRAWREIRRTLEANKIPAEAAALSVNIREEELSVHPTAPLSGSVPMLVKTTFHPSWLREDGRPTYSATPFFTLTFVRGPVRIKYERQWSEWVSIYCSAGGFILLCSYAFRRYNQPLWGSAKRDENDVRPKLSIGRS